MTQPEERIIESEANSLWDAVVYLAR
jgi:hypothetical protein